MKLAIQNTSFPAGWSLEEIFSATSSAGFSGIELSFDSKGKVSLESSEEDLKGVKALAEKYNLELHSLTSGFYWGNSITSDDGEVRKRALEFSKSHIKAASILTCDTVLIVPGYVSVDFIPNCPIVDYDKAYERATEWLNEVKSVAEEYKVNIGIENVWNNFLLSPLEMRDFIDKADSPFVGSYFDVGNVLKTGYPQQWIKILGSRIKKVHLKDYKTKVGTLSGFVDLLSGDVNYPLVISALKEIGYDGYLTAEIPFNPNYPLVSLKNMYETMSALIK